MAEKVLKSFSEEEKKKITEIQSKVLAITSRRKKRIDRKLQRISNRRK